MLASRQVLVRQKILIFIITPWEPQILKDIEMNIQGKR